MYLSVLQLPGFGRGTLTPCEVRLMFVCLLARLQVADTDGTAAQFATAQFGERANVELARALGVEGDGEQLNSVSLRVTQQVGG